MRFFTCSMSKVKALKKNHSKYYTDFTIVDITIKSGNKAFAPTWDMVMSHKDEKITDEEYTRLYYEIMRASYSNQYVEWDKLLNLDKVLIVCFCKAGNFCHRKLLAHMLVKCGAEHWGELT